jgi:hypothetical protein
MMERERAFSRLKINFPKAPHNNMSIIAQMNLFCWKEIKNFGDLDRLRLVIENAPDEELAIALEKQRGKGRNDYPVRAMLNSYYAKIVFGHESTASLIRELRRNPALAQLCGFNIFGGKLPAKSNYSRFLSNLRRNKRLLTKVFCKLVELLSQELPDLGKELGVDSKAINSLSRHANKNKQKDGRRDTTADYGVKKYKGIDKNGKEWEKQKSWYGYKVHILADVKYEIPVSFFVTKASESDMKNLLPLLKELSLNNPEVLSRGQTLVADRGYDSEENIMGLINEYEISPLIGIINRWRKSEDKEKLLFPDKADNITYDYNGNVYCYCPLTSTKHKMAYAGYEKKRKSLKFRCPAMEYGFKCAGKEICCGKNKSRIVRIPTKKDPRVFLPIARNSYKFKKLYSKRTAVERINSRLDVSFGFERHYIRGIEKMEINVSLAFITMLSMAYARVKQKKMALIRSIVRVA